MVLETVPSINNKMMFSLVLISVVFGIVSVDAGYYVAKYVSNNVRNSKHFPSYSNTHRFGYQPISSGTASVTNHRQYPQHQKAYLPRRKFFNTGFYRKYSPRAKYVIRRPAPLWRPFYTRHRYDLPRFSMSSYWNPVRTQYKTQLGSLTDDAIRSRQFDEKDVISHRSYPSYQVIDQSLSGIPKVILTFVFHYSAFIPLVYGGGRFVFIKPIDQPVPPEQTLYKLKTCCITWPNVCESAMKNRTATTTVRTKGQLQSETPLKPFEYSQKPLLSAADKQLENGANLKPTSNYVVTQKTSQALKTSKQSLTTSVEALKTSQQSLTTLVEALKTSQQSLTTSVEALKTSQQSLTTSVEELKTSQQSLATSSEEINTSQEYLTTSSEPLPTSKEPSTALIDILSTITADITTSKLDTTSYLFDITSTESPVPDSTSELFKQMRTSFDTVMVSPVPTSDSKSELVKQMTTSFDSVMMSASDTILSSVPTSDSKSELVKQTSMTSTESVTRSTSETTEPTSPIFIPGSQSTDKATTRIDFWLSYLLNLGESDEGGGSGDIGLTV